MSSTECIYMMRTREFKNQNSDVYKIGRTAQNINARIQKYGKGAELICHEACEDCVSAERGLIKLFKEKYTQATCYGREYFIGPQKDMEKSLQEYIKKYRKKTSKVARDSDVESEKSEVSSEDEDLGDTTFKTFEKDPKLMVKLKEKMIEAMGSKGVERLAQAKNAVYWKALSALLSKIILSGSVDEIFTEISKVKEIIYKTRRGFILKMVKKFTISDLGNALKIKSLKGIILPEQASGKSHLYWKRACNLLAYFCIVDYKLAFVSESANYLLKTNITHKSIDTARQKFCSVILTGATNTHRMMARAKVVEEKQRVIELY